MVGDIAAELLYWQEKSVLLSEGDGVLDERIVRDLGQIHKRLDVEGKLLSTAQLSGYYETFRQRFEPDKLAGLDGESLLEVSHGPGKDSLVSHIKVLTGLK